MLSVGVATVATAAAVALKAGALPVAERAAAVCLGMGLVEA